MLSRLELEPAYFRNLCLGAPFFLMLYTGMALLWIMTGREDDLTPAATPPAFFFPFLPFLAANLVFSILICGYGVGVGASAGAEESWG